MLKNYSGTQVYEDCDLWRRLMHGPVSLEVTLHSRIFVELTVFRRNVEHNHAHESAIVVPI